ncbi:MAG: hypothetical protein V7603_6075 [Micromonosporaceae bacterium]|jgi:hypothetical protein
MDLFARTFLPAATDAGLAMPTVTRHLPVVRRCLGPGNAVLLVARCVRPDHPLAGEHLLVLTRHRMVITRESRLLHKARLHLDAPIQELSRVTWSPDPRLVAVELAATAIDGIRERFWIKVRHPKAVWLLDATFGYVFQAAARALHTPAAA